MAKTSSQDTIIAQGVRVEGNLIAEGNILIDGEVKGTIVTQSDLDIGVDARVEASIQARNATLSGVIEGNVRVEERLDMLASSKFKGDIVAGLLSVEAGAEINGTVRMGVEAEPQTISTKPSRRGRSANATPVESLDDSLSS